MISLSFSSDFVFTLFVVLFTLRVFCLHCPSRVRGRRAVSISCLVFFSFRKDCNRFSSVPSLYVLFLFCALWDSFSVLHRSVSFSSLFRCLPLRFSYPRRSIFLVIFLFLLLAHFLSNFLSRILTLIRLFSFCLLEPARMGISVDIERTWKDRPLASRKELIC